jgi:putative transposase
MARNRYKIFDDDYPYFLTATTVDWIALFSKPELVRILLDSLIFMQKAGRMTVYAYVVMRDHIHFIASSNHLSKEVGDFKSFTARKIIDHLKTQKEKALLKQLSEGKLSFKTDRTYQLWQEGSHPEQIQSREMMIQKVEYIHFNPVRKGYVNDPVHWQYSSASNYFNGTGLISVCTDW